MPTGTPPSTDQATAARPPGTICPELADALGTLGLYLFALTAWAAPALNRFALGLCILALALSPEARSRLGRAPAFYLALLYLAYVALQAWRGAVLLPGSEAHQAEGLAEWLPLAGFLAIAWWLRADPKRIGPVLVSAVIGRLLGLWHEADWRQVLSFHADWQTGFNLPAQTSGLIAAHTILGLVLFLPRILAGGAAAGRFRARRLLAWLLALYLSTYLLVVSQARGTWLAAIVVFAAVFGYRRLSARKAGEPAQALSQPVVAALLLVALLAVAGLARNADSFLRRAAPDLEAAGSILRGEAVNRQDSSFSYRYNVQKFGLRKWLERPLLGWGAGASRPLIEASGDPRLYQAQSGRYLGRMHNAYIEIGVRFGLVGLAFLAAAIGYSLSSLADARREGRIREDFRLLALGGLGLLLLWGFTSTFTSAAWQAYWMLLMGLATTYSWVVKGPTEGAGGTFLVIADSRPWP